MRFGLTAITRWRVSKYVLQYWYMNFISGNRMVPPVFLNLGCTASADTSAILPPLARTCRKSKIACRGNPNTLSRISEMVPTTSPSNLAHSVVVVGSAW